MSKSKSLYAWLHVSHLVHLRHIRNVAADKITMRFVDRTRISTDGANSFTNKEQHNRVQYEPKFGIQHKHNLGSYLLSIDVSYSTPAMKRENERKLPIIKDIFLHLNTSRGMLATTHRKDRNECRSSREDNFLMRREKQNFFRQTIEYILPCR